MIMKDETEEMTSKSIIQPEEVSAEQVGAENGADSEGTVENPASESEVTGVSGNSGGDGESVSGGEQAVYTADEVRALLRTEGERLVESARRKWESEMSGEIGAAAKECAREMTSKLTREADGLRRALEEAERKMASRERELKLVCLLDSRGLSKKLLPLISAAEEGTEEALADELSAVISEEAARRVSERLRSPAPSLPPKRRVPTADELRTLPVAELQEMLR